MRHPNHGSCSSDDMKTPTWSDVAQMGAYRIWTTV